MTPVDASHGHQIVSVTSVDATHKKFLSFGNPPRPASVIMCDHKLYVVLDAVSGSGLVPNVLRCVPKERVVYLDDHRK